AGLFPEARAGHHGGHSQSFLRLVLAARRWLGGPEAALRRRDQLPIPPGRLRGRGGGGVTLYLAREIDLAVPTARQTLDKILAGYERSGGSWDAAINTGYFDASRAYGDIVFWSRLWQDNPQPWPYLIIGLDGRARVAEASPRVDPAKVRHA